MPRSGRAVRILTVLVALVVIALAAQPSRAARLPQPLEPPRTGGLETLDRALARLSIHARVLVIGAHPDDEDSSLLTLVAGLGGEAAYFSLSRGEGGQNLIGPELGVGLGLLRTEELLAARRVEGNRQYFSRAYDFGYTRSLDETLERWPRAELLEDAARVVRRFKPQIIVSIFRDGGGGTHGQHQAAGVVAHEIFRRAGDPTFHPEQIAAGLAPWTPTVLYRRAGWQGEEAPTMEVELQGVDPITGRGWGQVAAASRSQHRSQDMGRLQRPGTARTSLVWVAGAEAGRDGFFAGIDTGLTALADPIDDPERREAARELLARTATTATTARRALTPVALGESLASLHTILSQLTQAEDLAVEDAAGAPSPAADLLREKRQVAEEAILAAGGVAVEALADRARVVPGDSVEVTAAVWNSGNHEVVVQGADLVAGPGWSGGDLLTGSAGGRPIAPGELAEWTGTAEVVADAAPTRPYFLTRPLQGDLYDWSDAEEAERGEPFGPPPLTLELRLTIDGTSVSARREVVHSWADQARGEVRRPLQVVPALEVSVAPALVVHRRSLAAPQEIEVKVSSNLGTPCAGTIEVGTPEGWESVTSAPFAIADAEGTATVALRLAVPAGAAAGRYRLPVAARRDGGGRFAGSYPDIAYEHVRPRPWPHDSVLDLELIDLELPALRRLAWVRGASDAVVDALRDLGLPIDVLDAAGVAAADLEVYDVVVIGSRAYETDEALGRVNAKLLDYARGGGTLIVQYQQYQFSNGGFAPYAFEIARPHDRITDETAPVRLLEPQHPVFNHPNRLTEDDWRGWVQERGLYFAGSWGPELRPLLAMKDPDETEQMGGLLVADLGAGRYVYTGLAFFRQIPAGVPGAFRLLANLLALGERR
jgi:LmbE family N-acetylglucosaminyl deacetylase